MVNSTAAQFNIGASGDVFRAASMGTVDAGTGEAAILEDVRHPDGVQQEIYRQMEQFERAMSEMNGGGNSGGGTGGVGDGPGQVAAAGLADRVGELLGTQYEQGDEHEEDVAGRGRAEAKASSALRLGEVVTGRSSKRARDDVGRPERSILGNRQRPLQAVEVPNKMALLRQRGILGSAGAGERCAARPDPARGRGGALGGRGLGASARAHLGGDVLDQLGHSGRLVGQALEQAQGSVAKQETGFVAWLKRLFGKDCTARRRGDPRAAPRSDGRGSDSRNPRASDDVGSGARGI